MTASPPPRAATPRLTAARDGYHARLDALAANTAAGKCSPAQARAWAAASGRGFLHFAQQVGHAEHLGDDGVRRVMTPGAEHCTTCPGKARTFGSLAECLAETGGWPGDGSDECHGNCLCHLEPQRLYSVFADTSQSLVRRGGSSRWPTTPTTSNTPSPLTGRAGVGSGAGAPSGPATTSPAQVRSEPTGTLGPIAEAEALLQAKRGIPPEDQVPPEYREIERWAYKDHYLTALRPPPEVLQVGLPGAIGHAGHGRWHPLDLVHDEQYDRPAGWEPDPRATQLARQAALEYLAGLGLRDEHAEQTLWALKRWSQGHHGDPRVVGLVDRYLAVAPPYPGPILRGLSLPAAADGWPDLTRYDPRIFEGEERLVRPAGRPIGIDIERAFRVPRPKAFSGGRPLPGNVYEVLEVPHTGGSIRGFSVFWAQDEVILPRSVHLVPIRSARVLNPDGQPCAILHLRVRRQS
ncbi:MAG: hypothetical protein HYU66_19770 [Armatimonadetes bacterium]|nr:hypothetical protein [Armatimonadota bacterium]